jgi:prepilin-type N-terminal cleavage/methylation domain-containing protein
MHPVHTPFSRSKIKGFTLVEILVAMAIGVAVIAAVAQTFVVVSRIIYKNQVVDKALTNTRLIQEHLTRELSGAISQTEKTPYIRPEVSGTGTPFSYADPHTGGTVTYTYYPTLTYRVPVGSVAFVQGATSSGQKSIVINQTGDVLVEAGDYLVMDTTGASGIGTSSTGKSLKITDISGLIGAAGNLTLSLDPSIGEAQVNAGTTAANVPNNNSLTIQRERRYDVVAGSNGLHELR